MPIYEYRCSQCGHRFDKLARAGDEEPACPSCHSRQVERLPSVPGWIGWYGSARDSGCAPRRYT